MFSGLEILVFCALIFVFVTSRNDHRALAERLDKAEGRVHALQQYVQEQKAAGRDRQAVLRLLVAADGPIRLRLREGVERRGVVRSIDEQGLYLEGLPTPYDEGKDPSLRTEYLNFENIEGYLDDAGFWQRMPGA